MSTATEATRKKLALAIIDYLNTSVEDGTLSSEDRDSIDVATNCIAECFKVDPTDKNATSEALGNGQNLLSIYTVYEKLRGGSSPASGSSNANGGASKPPAPASTGPNPEAEQLKGKGNVAMQQKDYEKAVDFYSQAIDLTPTNPIYLSNRAAAYSAMKQHEAAKQDAEMAVAADPKYTKAWSRLGLARFALGDAKGSMEAYKSGIDAEGNGGSDAMRKGYETAKKRVEEEEEDDEDDIGSARDGPAPGAGGGGMPDLSALAGMFGGGGAGGGGGMPDIGALMQNPMMRQMASSLMSNPDMMSGLMNNPRLRAMASSCGGGGGMPDIAGMMQDPSIAAM
jgi:small glutamine-rich tetratricopeptide repeat-containing protein alpha